MDELLMMLSDVLVVKFPVIGGILTVLGAMVVSAQMIVAATPSKKDDAKLEELKKKSWVKSLWNFFLGFAPMQKKAKEEENK